MSRTWQLRTRALSLEKCPSVMGILNVTPDSFSDAGKHQAVVDAVDAALRMEDDGAAIIDIGGESTRPYSEPVSEAEELRRVIPVLQGLQGRLGLPISIDTSKAVVAKAAIEMGAEIINDVTGLEGDARMGEVAATSQAGVCVMHMQGTPQTMQDQPRYQNVVEEIVAYLQQRADACCSLGIAANRICLDPGIGFGKTHEHNIELLRGVRRFLELPYPILIGHSRKGFIAHVLGDRMTDRDAGTLGVSLAMAAAGIQLLRVHNVRDTVHALRLFNVCRGGA